MTAKKQPNEKDYITNKVLIVFSICLLGVLGLMMIYRVMDIMSTWWIGMIIVKTVCAIGAVGLLAGLAKIASERKAGSDMRYRLLRGRNIAVVGAVVTVIMLIIWKYGVQSIKMFYVILPALAVYYLIYHSYPREFFIVAADCGIAAALLWGVRTALSSSSFGKVSWAVAAIAVALAAVQAVLVLRVRKTGCKGMIEGKRVALFTAAHAYDVMLATGALMAVLVVVGAVLGAQIAYYLMFAAFAYLFVSAVYYTVKML